MYLSYFLKNNFFSLFDFFSKVQTPETMQETFMSDSEDELGKIYLYIYLGTLEWRILMSINIMHIYFSMLLCTYE